MSVPVITDTEALATFCDAVREAPFVCVDTEFLRERTYWPQLCLVQLAGGEHETIVDPQAPDIDLRPLTDLLADTGVMKVFHAARQDVEIFYHISGVLPQPLHDTQIAAMVLGFGDAVSYENLVREFLGESIDKSSRFTDWSRRPLTDKQLAYALSDVTHLREIYPKLMAQVEERGRLAWVEEEIEATLLDEALYRGRPEDAWQRLKLRGVKAKKLSVAMALAAWREEEAQKRNVPRGRLMKDDALLDIAQHAPRTTGELAKLRSVPQGFENSRHAAGVLAAVAHGLERPKEDIPDLDNRTGVPKSKQPLLELLKVVLRAQCEIHDVAPKLVASVADLERIVLSDEADVPALRGWRRVVFGEAALAVKHGRCSIGVHEGSVTLFQHEPD